MFGPRGARRPGTGDCVGRYLESHARRIFSVAVKPDTAEASALAKKVLSGDLPDEFALRDVYRNGWIGLGTRDAAARAVEVLCDLDWLAELEQPTRTRPRTRYQINPRLQRKRQAGTDKTDRSPQGVADDPNLSVLSVGGGGEPTNLARERDDQERPPDGG